MFGNGSVTRNAIKAFKKDLGSKEALIISYQRKHSKKKKEEKPSLGQCMHLWLELNIFLTPNSIDHIIIRIHELNKNC